MKYLSFPSRYEKQPKTVLSGTERAFSGFSEIAERLRTIQNGILAIEMYPGVDKEAFRSGVIDLLGADLCLDFETCRKTPPQFHEMLDADLSEDRVFGRMHSREPEDYFQESLVASLKERVLCSSGLKIVYGFGASLTNWDHLVYVDLTRWEIQLRFRRGIPNFSADNGNEDPLRKFKRGYFADWRVADLLKKRHYLQAEWVISGEDPSHPVMISQTAFQAGLDRLVSGPFRLIPYFDPGIWGGHWMEEVCGLPPNGSNYAWSFDGVPEENALCLRALWQ